MTPRSRGPDGPSGPWAARPGGTRSAAPETRTVCRAVYTRTSTEEGLDSDLNTLDAQREAGEAHGASQRSEGWGCLPERYDDGGFTGGNMERPALQRLFDDIEAVRRSRYLT